MTIRKEFIRGEWRDLESCILRIFKNICKLGDALSEEQEEIVQKIVDNRIYLSDSISKEVLKTISGRVGPAYKKMIKDNRDDDTFFKDVAYILDNNLSAFDSASCKASFLAFGYAMCCINKDKDFEIQSGDKLEMLHTSSLLKLEGEDVRPIEYIEERLEEISGNEVES